MGNIIWSFCCLFFSNRIVPPESIDYQKILLNKGGKFQSTIIEEDSIIQGSNIYRKNRELSHFMIRDGQRIENIWQAFQYSVVNWPLTTCFGVRPYQLFDDENGKNVTHTHPEIPNLYLREKYFNYITYNEAYRIAIQIGFGFRKLQLQPKCHVGIYSSNRMEWMLCALALWNQNMVVIPYYDTFGIDSIQYIINHCDNNVIVVSKENIQKVISIIEKCVNLKIIIQFDYNSILHNTFENVDPDQISFCKRHNILLIGLSEIIKLGQQSEQHNEFEVIHANGSDVAMIMYTSGTTGLPKGVLLTHHNITCGCGFLGSRFLEELNVYPTDVLLSYLPLAHIFEISAEILAFSLGVTICYYSGHVKLLVEDLQLSQPTILPGVPKVWKKIYEKIFSSASLGNFISKGLFNLAIHNAIDNYRHQLPANRILQALVLNTIKKKVGLSNIRLIISGGAPLEPYIHEFFRSVINVPFCEGYGLTETSSAFTLAQTNDIRAGHCGPPIECCEVKLVDVPEMKYTSQDSRGPQGEIWVRGDDVFIGYYKNPEVTKEVLTADGWFRTGDIGRFNPNGTLSVIDRKKNIFKLSQGEYIVPEKLEGFFGQSNLIGQIWIYGNSYMNYIVAVVVPNFDTVMQYAKNNHWLSSLPNFSAFSSIVSFEKICQKYYSTLCQMILNDINHIACIKQLKSYEIPKSLILESDIDELFQGFTISKNLLTSTLKLRRYELFNRYQYQIDQLYHNIGD